MRGFRSILPAFTLQGSEPAPLLGLPQEHLGFAPELLAPIDVSEAPKAAPKPELPPYNPYTIGSLEDTMQNW